MYGLIILAFSSEMSIKYPHQALRMDISTSLWQFNKLWKITMEMIGKSSNYIGHGFHSLVYWKISRLPSCTGIRLQFRTAIRLWECPNILPKLPSTSINPPSKAPKFSCTVSAKTCGTLELKDLPTKPAQYHTMDEKWWNSPRMSKSSQVLPFPNDRFFLFPALSQEPRLVPTRDAGTAAEESGKQRCTCTESRVVPHFLWPMTCTWRINLIETHHWKKDGNDGGQFKEACLSVQWDETSLFYNQVFDMFLLGFHCRSTRPRRGEE